MAVIPNSVRVTGLIAPSDDTDTYPSHDSRLGKGGYREVATTTDRDNIPLQRQEVGMLVYVQPPTDTIYKLTATGTPGTYAALGLGTSGLNSNYLVGGAENTIQIDGTAGPVIFSNNGAANAIRMDDDMIIHFGTGNEGQILYDEATNDALTIRGSTQASNAGFDVRVHGGDTSGAFAGGDLYLDGGATSGGTEGVIYLGNQHASQIVYGSQTSPTHLMYLADNNASSLIIKQGASNEYLKIDTTTVARVISFGNATTNPAFNFLGTGTVTINGNLLLSEQSGDPSTPTNAGYLYTKEVSGQTELFYKGTSGSAYQLTPPTGTSEWTDGGAYIYPADGASKEVSVGKTTAPSDASAIMEVANGHLQIGGTWDTAHLIMGTSPNDYHLWVDTSGNLRIKNGSPSSDTDGIVVGMQNS